MRKMSLFKVYPDLYKKSFNFSKFDLDFIPIKRTWTGPSFMTIPKMNFTKKLLKSGKTVLDGPMKPMNNTGLTVKLKIYSLL